MAVFFRIRNDRLSVCAFEADANERLTIDSLHVLGGVIFDSKENVWTVVDSLINKRISRLRRNCEEKYVNRYFIV